LNPTFGSGWTAQLKVGEEGYTFASNEMPAFLGREILFELEGTIDAHTAKILPVISKSVVK